MEEYTEVPKIQRGGKYDWSEILDGGKWTLRGGENSSVSKADRDFDSTALSFAQNARGAAKRLGVKLVTCAVRRVEDGKDGELAVYIQAEKPKK